MNNHAEYTILSISDDNSVYSFVSECFINEVQSYNVIGTLISDKALDIIDEKNPDIILLDICTNTEKGIKFLKSLKNYEETTAIPVIVIADDNIYVERAVDEGAADFLKMPFDKVELTVRVKSILSLFKLIKGIATQAEELEIQSHNLEQQKKQLETAKEKSDELLKNILPNEIAEQLKNKGKVDAKMYRMVSILFTDFKDFTKISSELEPDEIIEELSVYFGKFDEIIGNHFIEKIKTIGDAYMCVGGLPLRNKSNPIDTVLAALEIQEFIKNYNIEKHSKGLAGWELRIGIHTGKVIAGVIGTKKFAYDIWGDAVNTASRIETSSIAGEVNISEATYKHIEKYFDCTYRGKIEAKNKGEIDMYFVKGLKPEFCIEGNNIIPNEHFFEILSSY